MDVRALRWGAGSLFVAVAFGAFGAHGLKAFLSAAELAQWNTAVAYQFHHGLGLLLIASLGNRLPTRAINAIRVLFVLGISLFCGSIYLLSTRGLLGMEGAGAILGPITPLGGLCFLAGWAVLLITAWRGTDLG